MRMMCVERSIVKHIQRDSIKNGIFKVEHIDRGNGGMEFEIQQYS